MGGGGGEATLKLWHEQGTITKMFSCGFFFSYLAALKQSTGLVTGACLSQGLC